MSHIKDQCVGSGGWQRWYHVFGHHRINLNTCNNSILNVVGEHSNDVIMTILYQPCQSIMPLKPNHYFDGNQQTFILLSNV